MDCVIVMKLITILYINIDCQTPTGLSMIFYLKVPKCIEDKPPTIQLHDNNIDIDGHTGLITSTNTIHDVYRLKLDVTGIYKT